RFATDNWGIIFFSAHDSFIFLQGLGLSDEEIRTVHENCQGMPGYLAAIRRLIAVGVRLNDLPSTLPTELAGIFQIEWDRMRIEQAEAKVLALLAFAKEPLALDIVASAANLDSHKAKTIVERLSFLKFDPRTGNLGYISDAYKGFVADRLASMREESEEVLIEHYLRSPHEKASLFV